MSPIKIQNLHHLHVMWMVKFGFWRTKLNWQISNACFFFNFQLIWLSLNSNLAFVLQSIYSCFLKSFAKYILQLNVDFEYKPGEYVSFFKSQNGKHSKLLLDFDAKKNVKQSIETNTQYVGPSVIERSISISELSTLFPMYFDSVKWKW